MYALLESNVALLDKYFANLPLVLRHWWKYRRGEQRGCINRTYGFGKEDVRSGEKNKRECQILFGVTSFAQRQSL